MSTKQEQHRCHCGSWDYQHVEGTGRCLITDCECKAFQSRAAMNEEITVEEALEELGEMFYGKSIAIRRDDQLFPADCQDGAETFRSVAIKIGYLDSDPKFRSRTLAEAMAQVRDWKAQQ